MSYEEWAATLFPFEAKTLTRKEIFQAGAASRDVEIAELQAHIDELMLEYCPNEMTKEQLEEWGRNQVAVPEDSLPEALAKVRKP